MTDEKQLWDRRDDEGTKAYEAFCAYRDMGPKRSTTKVPKALGRPEGYIPVIYRWSAKNGWVERAGAWDDYQDKIAREATIKEIEDMRKRHIQTAVALQTKALQRLQIMTPEELSATSVLGFIQEAIKIERMSRGEPETIMEERRRLTDDDARIISQLATDPEFMGALQEALDQAEGSADPDERPRLVAQERDRGTSLAEAKGDRAGNS